MTGERRDAWTDHSATCTQCREIGGVMGFLPEPSTARSGQRVGRYLLEEMLGRGAMGVVFAARDPELDRGVAVKLLRGPTQPERLRREAKALARLSHPNVVQ